MSTNVLRATDGWWVVRDERAVRVETKAVTTAELLAGRDAAARTDSGTPVAGLVALPPVTTPCRVIAQMVNYRSHARDSGFSGDIPPTFFRKASGSVTGPHDTIVRPAYVTFLDYEVELGLRRGRQQRTDLRDRLGRGLLREGDVVTATIATPDGRIDLGEQRNAVADAR